MGWFTGNVPWAGAGAGVGGWRFTVPATKPGTGFFSDAVISPVSMVCDDAEAGGTDTPFTVV